MALPFTTVPQIVNTGSRASQDTALAATTKINSGLTGLLSNDQALDARLATVEGRVNSAIGTVATPLTVTSANPTPWATATVKNQVTSGAANSATGGSTSLAARLLSYLLLPGTTTFGGKTCKIVVALSTAYAPATSQAHPLSTSSYVYLQAFAIAADGTITAGAALSAAPSFSNALWLESQSASSFTIHLPTTDYPATVNTGTLAVTLGSSVTRTANSRGSAGGPYLWDQAGGMGRVGRSCGTATIAIVGQHPIELTAFMATATRGSSTDVSGGILADFLGASSPAAIGVGADQLPGTNLFVVAHVDKVTGLSPRLAIFLAAADDNSQRKLAEVTLPSTTPVTISVHALDATHALVRWYDGTQYDATVVTVTGGTTAPYGLALGVQSPGYIGGTAGMQLPLGGVLLYDSSDPYLVTKESATGNNAFALRRLTFDPTGAANPALAESASAPVAFAFGATQDSTTGFASFGHVAIQVWPDLMLVGANTANSAAATAPSVGGAIVHATVALS